MKLQNITQKIANRLLHIGVDSDLYHERFGSAYGGWDVVPDGLGAGSIVYSFGVGEDISFDLELIRRFGCTVRAFDPTPRSIEWVRMQDIPSQFVLHEYGIAATDGEITIYPPENPAYVSHTMIPGLSDRPGILVPVKSLGTIMKTLGHERIDLLKMDVEGAEYEVIEGLVDSPVRPGQILVEFHHRFPGVGTGRTKRALRQLRSAGYKVFWVSETKEEVGLIRRF
jgi:FkbM family methyltransferase